jgi:hypothetical protein
MARPLIVEPNTDRLHVMLIRECATVNPAEVTLTVTRKGETVRPPNLAPCLDPCRQLGLCVHNLTGDRWGECGKLAPTLAIRPSPSKTYVAVSVEQGIATFVIDHDLTDAPSGWYWGRITVAGCEVAVMTIWVRCIATLARA